MKTAKKASGAEAAPAPGEPAPSLAAWSLRLVRSLWFWVALAFVLLAGGWIMLLVAARHANTTEVPLARPASPP